MKDDEDFLASSPYFSGWATADPFDWSPGETCVFGHQYCSVDNTVGGQCSGQKVLWELREDNDIDPEYVNAIIRSIWKEDWS